MPFDRDESSDHHQPHTAMPHQPAPIQPRSESWGKDKRAVVGWVAATLGAAILAWGIWITSAMYEGQARDALTIQRIEAAERGAQERVADLRAQLLRIETTLAEIQRDLRMRSRP